METPDRKVTIGLAANALMSLFAWVLKLGFGIEMPGEMVLSGATVLLFALQYLVPNAPPPAVTLREGGFARLGLLWTWVVAAVAVLGLLCMSGCMNTREAYKAAQAPDEYAYVLAEHYSSVLHQAVVLKRNPATPREVVQALQALELKLTPAVYRLKELRDAYLQVKTAQTEAQLQAAIDQVVRLLADMIRQVRAGGGGSVSRLDEPILWEARLLEARA